MLSTLIEVNDVVGSVCFTGLGIRKGQWRYGVDHEVTIFLDDDDGAQYWLGITKPKKLSDHLCTTSVVHDIVTKLVYDLTLC